MNATVKVLKLHFQQLGLDYWKGIEGSIESEPKTFFKIRQFEAEPYWIPICNEIRQQKRRDK
jgi:hypothetical protein